MAQRTVALCDGKYIGIETIYTVINGQQIIIYWKNDIDYQIDFQYYDFT